MHYSTLISTEQLAKHYLGPDWVCVDCRFALNDPDAGYADYLAGHIANARYAHLDQNLASEITVQTGRHPLPDIDVLAAKLGAWGIDNDTQVIAYDEAEGSMAARLWWLLRFLGHAKVAVLNGGIREWQRQGQPVTTDLPVIRPAVFKPAADRSLYLTTAEVKTGLENNAIRLIDARTAARYQGEQEPIDPIAGHIPGALNRPYQQNLDRESLFLDNDTLRTQFSSLIADSDPQHIVHMCGSGVTACHNLLAMEAAGLNGSKLYAGSWSEWIRNPDLPVAVKNPI